MNGIRVQTLRFVDDIAVTAKEELGDTLGKMNNSFNEYNMKINKSKTKILVCRASNCVELERNNSIPKVRNGCVFLFFMECGKLYSK